MAAKRNDPLPGAMRPGDPIDLDQSVAGEEDPGASIELAMPRAGEDACPHCGGTGRVGAASCPDCLGTGRGVTGLDGA